ncbi:MAG: ABC transporter substrate-binding protein [Clostridia bacterium]|nr:ABC transporter substrate-binding protein [Clostridia bacterium]
MKKIIAILLVVLMLPVFASCQSDDDKYTIGICQLVQHPALDAATQGFIDAINEEMGEENVSFLKENASNDSSVCTTIVNNFVSKKVDLIMANATPALQAAVNGTADIPILGTSVTAYSVALGIDVKDNLIGENISGTSDLAPLDLQANMITDLFPATQKVALLFCNGEPNSKYQVTEIAKLLKAKNIETKEFGFTDSNDVSAVSAAAAAWADVIYVPTDNTAASCTETINGAIGNKPLIAGEEGICSGCGVATLTIDYYDLGYTTGLMAVKILKGEAKISEMKIEFVPAEKCTYKYNAEKCKAFNIDTAALDAKGYKKIGE